MGNANRYLSPPDVAELLGINSSKVLAFIRTGELRAVNVATSLIGRPRWRISPADLAVFEERRSAVAPVKSRPRRQAAQVIEFF